MRIRLSGILVAAVTAAVLPAASAAAGLVPTWTAAPPVPTPAGSTNNVLRDVNVLTPDDVWAIGASWKNGEGPLAVHWNGTAWTNATMPSQGTGIAYSLTAVDGVASDDVWAVGATVPEIPNPSLADAVLLHYDGNAWSTATGPPALVGSHGTLADVDVRGPDDGWAVGQTTVGTAPSQPLILRWRAGQWTPVATPPTGFASQLTSVFAVSGKDVWAVGTQTRPGGDEASLMLHWDGVSWAEVAVPDIGGASSSETLESVAVLASGDLWAVGSTCLTTGPRTCGPLVWLLSHGAWKRVPAALGAELTEVVGFSPSDVWVFGYVGDPGPGQVGHAEHWDGQRFTTDGTVTGVLPPVSSNGKLASAVALAGAAGDPVSGVLWAVGWSENPALLPQAIYRK